MPEGRDVDDVRIIRMHDNRADLTAVLQSDIRQLRPPSTDL